MNKGFTLIELLIVVAIIGILAAVGATVIPNILQNTKITVVTKQINQVADFVQVVMMNCQITGGSMNLYVPPGWGIPLTNPGHCTKSTIDQKGSGLKNHMDDQWDLRNVYESKKHKQHKMVKNAMVKATKISSTATRRWRRRRRSP